MKYAVNEEGVKFLRVMSGAIIESIDAINSYIIEVQITADKNLEALGPHGTALNSALLEIKSMIKNAGEPAEIISDQLDEIACGYEAVIENDRFIGNESNGNAGRNTTEVAGNCTKDSVEQILYIDCINKSLEGKNHPITGIPFERKQIEIDGKAIVVVVPKFESFFDAQLSDDLLESRDGVQFRNATLQLRDEIENNTILSDMFDDEQIEQIENGDTPTGFVWHHDAEVGKMQLVDFNIHDKTAHTGGRHIWGGGTKKR